MSSKKVNGVALFIEYNDVCELKKMRSIKLYMKNMIARPTIGFAFGLEAKKFAYASCKPIT